MASVAKNHPAQLVPQAFHFFRVGCCAEAVGEIQKLLLLARLGLEDLLREVPPGPGLR
jgi:hypothetical protein